MITLHITLHLHKYNPDICIHRNQLHVASLIMCQHKVKCYLLLRAAHPDHEFLLIPWIPYSEQTVAVILGRGYTDTDSRGEYH